ncbi:MAG TPA: hypothetical protein VK188_12790 [Holophaga sp.]|nr:hypothetical protein [Holophaga sp.]
MPGRLTGGIVLYLVLPVLLFLALWCRPLVGLPALALLGFGLWRGLRPLSWGAGNQEAPWRGHLVPALLAVAWCSLGGAGHFFYANKVDWFVRDAVFRDLVTTPWPIGYRVDDALFLLRAPLGYYLPPALVGKLLPLRFADLLLWAWTALGVHLLLRLATHAIRSQWKKLAFGLVLVLFSGMDVLGWALVMGEWPRFTQHLEWWGMFFQYSSHTTQLFWVPNHSIPAWLAMGLLWQYRKTEAIAALLPALLLALAFWAPFAAIGLIPFLVAFALHRFPDPGRLRTLAWQVGAALPAVLILGTYLSAQAASAGGAFKPSFLGHLPWGAPLFPVLLLAFHALEWLLLLLILQVRARDPWLWIAGGILAALPLFWFGPGNDFVMRGSIPSLFMLAASAGAFLLQSDAGNRFWRGAVLVLLLIGCATPFEEIARSLDKPRWSPSLTQSLQDRGLGKIPPHYGAPASGGPLPRLLRAPHIVPRGPYEPPAQLPPVSTL